MELYDFVVMIVLTIVDGLRNNLEYLNMRQGSLPGALQVMVKLRIYATRCFQYLVAEGIDRYSITVCSAHHIIIEM